MEGVVDISGVPKVALLYRLWSGQVPASFFGDNMLSSPGFHDDLAKEAVKRYIDYFQGRAIKLDLSKDTIDPWLYDRDAGSGAFARAVSDLRKAMLQ